VDIQVPRHTGHAKGEGWALAGSGDQLSERHPPGEEAIGNVENGREQTARTDGRTRRPAPSTSCTGTRAPLAPPGTRSRLPRGRRSSVWSGSDESGTGRRRGVRVRSSRNRHPLHDDAEDPSRVQAATGAAVSRLSLEARGGRPA
jgi:hypothetical protein